MRITKFFLSKHSQWDRHTEAKDDVIAQRDKYVNNKENAIEEIVEEDLRFEVISMPQGYGLPQVFAILKLSYYPKN